MIFIFKYIYLDAFFTLLNGDALFTLLELQKTVQMPMLDGKITEINK